MREGCSIYHGSFSSRRECTVIPCAGSKKKVGEFDLPSPPSLLHLKKFPKSERSTATSLVLCQHGRKFNKEKIQYVCGNASLGILSVEEFHQIVGKERRFKIILWLGIEFVGYIYNAIDPSVKGAGTGPCGVKVKSMRNIST